jgi:hypothetical protein
MFTVSIAKNSADCEHRGARSMLPQSGFFTTIDDNMSQASWVFRNFDTTGEPASI